MAKVVLNRCSSDTRIGLKRCLFFLCYRHIAIDRFRSGVQRPAFRATLTPANTTTTPISGLSAQSVFLVFVFGATLRAQTTNYSYVTPTLQLGQLELNLVSGINDSRPNERGSARGGSMMILAGASFVRGTTGGAARNCRTLCPLAPGAAMSTDRATRPTSVLFRVRNWRQ